MSQTSIYQQLSVLVICVPRTYVQRRLVQCGLISHTVQDISEMIALEWNDRHCWKQRQSIEGGWQLTISPGSGSPQRVTV